MSKEAEGRRIVVVGGTGDLGGRVARRLDAAGATVCVASRDARGPAQGRIEYAKADVRDVKSLIPVLRDADGIVISVESALTGESDQNPERVHHDGLRNVVAAVGDRPRKPHVVFVTQIYVTRGDSPSNPMGNLFSWRWKAEEALRASGLPYTIVRPSWLTGGPGASRHVRFEQGDTGDGQVARDDVAEVIAQSLWNAEARGKTFELYNDAGPSQRDFGADFATLRADPRRS
jgi:uncharacterized protein YbjT (DUF2867 family)